MIGRAIFAAPFLLLAALFGQMFDFYYWRHLGCFNSEGRCYVSADGVVYHDTGVYWAIPTVILLAVGVAIPMAGARKPGRQKSET